MLFLFAFPSNPFNAFTVWTSWSLLNYQLGGPTATGATGERREPCTPSRVALSARALFICSPSLLTNKNINSRALIK